jgi:hypothetical protein
MPEKSVAAIPNALPHLHGIFAMLSQAVRTAQPHFPMLFLKLLTWYPLLGIAWIAMNIARRRPRPDAKESTATAYIPGATASMMPANDRR